MNSTTTLHPQPKRRALAMGIVHRAARWNDPPSVTGPPAPVSQNWCTLVFIGTKAIHSLKQWAVCNRSRICIALCMCCWVNTRKKKSWIVFLFLQVPCLFVNFQKEEVQRKSQISSMCSLPLNPSGEDILKWKWILFSRLLASDIVANCWAQNVDLCVWSSIVNQIFAETSQMLLPNKSERATKTTTICLFDFCNLRTLGFSSADNGHANFLSF